MLGKAIVTSLLVLLLLFSSAVVTQAVTIETVPVGDAGNAADSTGYGAVSYDYSIGKYEITAWQYSEFLNAVAQTDTYGLYNSSMWSDSYGCKIQQSGGSASYTYSVAPDYANRPVNYVSWADAARFSNWLTSGTTEDGSYYLNGATTLTALMAVTRKANAQYVIPSENEWYKASYYDPNESGGAGGYWKYPTQSNTIPSREAPQGTDPSNGSANYNVPMVDPTYGTTPVGAYSFKPSESAYGTYDQGGNVWEWNEAVFDSSSRGLRGGSFFDAMGADSLRSGSRIGFDPTREYSYLGFRVASVPEPSTLLLLILALACFSGFAWRRMMFAKVLGRVKGTFALAAFFGAVSVCDAATVNVADYLTNNGFETPEVTTATGDGSLLMPQVAGDWQGDQSAIVTTENGITPFEGSHMLNFIGTSATGAGSLVSSQVWQTLELPTGWNVGDIAQLSYAFNRVAGDEETDTSMRFGLGAYSGLLSDFNLNPTPLAYADGGVFTDGDPGTWQIASAELVIPEDTTYLAVQLWAQENVMNDTVAPEFDGHYADIVPEPATWVLLSVAGLMIFCWLRKSH